MMPDRALILVGPTAVGKTDIAIALAERLGGEIVSADSRQIYRYMTIGTAKPKPEQLAAVPHYFIDVCAPDVRYSAGQFSAEARVVIADIMARGKVPLIVGGSGLYVRALVDGLAEPRIADEAVKQRLKTTLAEQGLPSLYARLQSLDSALAARLNPSDSQRILRALEVYEITGKPFSDFIRKSPRPAAFEPCFVGLTMQRELLYKRIDGRVDHMIESGLIDEVKALRSRGYARGLNALQTVGYQEVFMFLEGEIDYDRMVALIKQKSRNYAKRQLTWFRKDKRIGWVALEAYPDRDRLLNLLVEVFRGEAVLPADLA